MPTVIIQNTRCKLDALFQWDRNQTLEIIGLSFAAAPEVHFASVTTCEAIVRQSVMNSAGVITVDIPNSLLEKPHDLTAWLCADNGNKFNSRYEIIIPVNPRPRPLSEDEENSFFEEI